MDIKDYYKILNIASTASTSEIKKAYRKMALRYHPDTNKGNSAMETQFREIKEAYEVLINPVKREEYNYKRWYNRTIGKSFIYKPTNAQEVFIECKKLNVYLSGTNPFQIDYDALNHHILEILSDTNREILLQLNEHSLTNEVITLLLQAANTLPYKYQPRIIESLIQLAGADREIQGKIELYRKRQQQKALFDKYKVTAVIILTLMICLIIYLSSK
ncbi:MAG TPA: DnaJ domain-containing protein [Chitinophagaceae bacterium]|nr:DnaJ domain-containing protein [Chitinophagaceae bacterium]